MSIQHFVDITIHANCTKENVENILKKGEEKGFVYRYDMIFLTSQEAGEKLTAALQSENVEGSVISVRIEGDCDALLSFYKSSQGLLEIHFGAFGSPMRKKFKEDMYYIDFDHYIRMALDLCKDFAIVKLETDSI